jgi:hypothetical protein
LRGIAAAPEGTLGYVEDLNQDVVEDTQWLLLRTEHEEVPLILGTSSGISNPRCQCGSEEAVKAIKPRQEVLDLQRVGFGTGSIQYHHLFILQN